MECCIEKAGKSLVYASMSIRRGEKIVCPGMSERFGDSEVHGAADEDVSGCQAVRKVPGGSWWQLN